MLERYIDLCVPEVWILLPRKTDGSLFPLKMQTLPGGAQTIEMGVRMGPLTFRKLESEQQPGPEGNPRDWKKPETQSVAGSKCNHSF